MLKNILQSDSKRAKKNNPWMVIPSF
jgi:hypothetical protein